MSAFWLWSIAEMSLSISWVPWSGGVNDFWGQGHRGWALEAGDER